MEYLVLMPAMYAHDWGMSVGVEEKKAIRLAAFPQAGQEARSGGVGEVHRLPDEGTVFLEFVRHWLG